MKRLIASANVEKKMVILRGAPGSGKSTKAKELANTVPQGQAVICSADDHFINEDGEYKFDFRELKSAHGECFNKAKQAVQDDIPLIIIDNTNTQRWEFAKYVSLAEENGYTVETVVCTGEYDNVHGVPEDKVQAMRDRFEE